MKKELICVIPARGGSKGIKNKNLRKVNGIPLIARSILTSKQSKYIGQVYVSSDSDQILRVAEQYGALTHKRRSEAASDNASTEDALKDFIGSLPEIPKELIYLQTTSCFTKSTELDQAIEIFFEDTKIDMLFSARKFHSFLWRKNRDSAAFSGVNHDNELPRKRRQALDVEEVLEDGGFYVMRTRQLLQTENRYAGVCVPFISSLPIIPEIDDVEDLELSCFLANYFDKSKIKLNLDTLFCDFDGVLTDDHVYIDTNGNETVKCTRADGMGCQLLTKKNIDVIILSSEENEVVKRRADKMKIKCFHNVKNKERFISEYTAKYKLDMNLVGFIGNDLNDLEALRTVGVPMITKDAAIELKKEGFRMLDVYGGEGVLRVVATLMNANY